MGYYRKAQICLNGHCICECIDELPELSQNFCKKCGKKTIVACPDCKAEIHGDFIEDVYGSSGKYKMPAFCHNCGSPYPWTQTALKYANDIIWEDEILSDMEKQELSESLQDVVSETPKTQLSIIRIKKGLLTVSKLTSEGIRQFIINFGCDFAIKSLEIPSQISQEVCKL